MKKTSITNAKKNLEDVVDKAMKKNRTFAITKYNKVRAYIIGIKELENLKHVKIVHD